MTKPEFVHLHVHSDYSLFDSTIRVETLVEETEKMGMPAVALTDTGNLFGAAQLQQAARRRGMVRPIFGVELDVMRTVRGADGYEGACSSVAPMRMVLLAETETGWRNLCRLVSAGRPDGLMGMPRVSTQLLEECRDGLICLCRPTPAQLSNADDHGFGNQWDPAYLHGVFGRKHCFLELVDDGTEAARLVNREVLGVSMWLGLDVVAANDVHILASDQAKARRLLHAFRQKKLLHEMPPLRSGDRACYLKSPEEMWATFSEVPEALRNTLTIAERCRVEIRPPRLRFCSLGGDADEILRRKAEEGLWLYAVAREGADAGQDSPDILSPRARERMEYELRLIKEAGLAERFLLAADIAEGEADAEGESGMGYPAWGVGGMAGSLVAWGLGIVDTDVIDPLGMNLFFDRALNMQGPHTTWVELRLGKGRLRKVWERRLQRRRSQDWTDKHVSPCLRFKTWDMRQAVALVAKVAPELVESMLEAASEEARRAFAEPGSMSERLWRVVKEGDEPNELQSLAHILVGLVCRPKREAGGIVVSGGLWEDGIAVCETPDAAPSPIQWSVGDALSLGLTCVWVSESEAVRWEQPISHGDSENMATREDVDRWTWEMIQRGDTDGVFNLGSSGMQDFLRCVRPDSFSDLMAVIMLYRPGPLQFADAFIARKHGEEPVTYPHPALEEILRETYGLILYQEQIIQIGMELAGMTSAEAEQWRRAFFRATHFDAPPEGSCPLTAFGRQCAARGIDESELQPVLDALKREGCWSHQKAYIATCAALAWRAARSKCERRLKSAAGGGGGAVEKCGTVFCFPGNSSR